MKNKLNLMYLIGIVEIIDIVLYNVRIVKLGELNALLFLL